MRQPPASPPNPINALRAAFKVLRDIRCYLLHRKWHTVLWTEGMPFPFDVFSYVWHCPRCDKGGGKGMRMPTRLGRLAGAQA